MSRAQVATIPGEPPEKRCTKCEVMKPITAFAIQNRRGRCERYSQCKECRNAAKQAWYKRNRATVLAYQRGYENASQRRSWLKTKYGLTPENFQRLHESQGGVCAICRKPQAEYYRYLDVDHCHVTGVVRGLLCRRCNNTLGLVKEDTALLAALAAYLAAARDLSCSTPAPSPHEDDPRPLVSQGANCPNSSDRVSLNGSARGIVDGRERGELLQNDGHSGVGARVLR